MAIKPVSVPARSFKDAVAEYATQLRALEAMPAGYGGEIADTLQRGLTAAETALLAAPSPDLWALVDKLQMVWRDGSEGLPEDRATLVQDAIRLAGGSDGPAIGFNPELWLKHWSKAGGAFIIRTDELVLLAPTTGDGADLDLLKHELDIANGREAVRRLLSRTCLAEEAA